MKVRYRKIADEGHGPPPWYGVAYRCEKHCEKVCYPIPINLLVRFWHNVIRHNFYKHVKCPRWGAWGYSRRTRQT